MSSAGAMGLALMSALCGIVFGAVVVAPGALRRVRQLERALAACRAEGRP